MPRLSTLLSLALVVLTPLLLQPGDALARDGGGLTFAVVRSAPTLQFDEEPEFEEDWDQPEQVNPRKERIKGALKIAGGSSLLLAGVGLGAGAVGSFVVADGFGGFSALQYGDVDGIAAGFMIFLGFLSAAASTVCIIIGVSLIVAGVEHLRTAREATATLDPQLRYERRARERVHWGMRFAMAPTPARR